MNRLAIRLRNALRSESDRRVERRLNALKESRTMATAGIAPWDSCDSVMADARWEAVLAACGATSAAAR